MRDESREGGWLEGDSYRFREFQRFRQWWLWGLILIPAVVSGVILIMQVGFGTPVGSRPASNELLLTMFVLLGGGLPLFLLSCSLRTAVYDDRLELRFRPFRRRVIPLAEIERVAAVTYRPMLDYGGWGIKLGSKGWCYNVSGSRGVEVHLTKGRMLMVGSQRAEELAEAIELALATSRSQPPRDAGRS